MDSSNGVSNPPGGRSSDIFNDTATPSPRKVKDYMKSHVFNGDASDVNVNVKMNGSDNGYDERSPRVNDNTQDRLFGATDNKVTPSPRRQIVNDTYRSNVFGIGDCTDGACTPRKKSPAIVNPITGNKLMLNGDYSQTNGACDVPKQNGYTNGVHHDNSPMETSYAKKVRAPPGGVSHGLW